MKRIAILFLLLSLKAFSQGEPFWEYLNGPETGTVNEIKVYNDTIYICCNNGLYMSVDTAKTWEHLFTARLIHFNVTSDGNIITHSEKKLYEYNINSKTLVELSSPEPKKIISNITIGPDNLLCIMLFTFTDRSYDIYMSSNMGKEWDLYESYNKSEYGYYIPSYYFDENGRLIILGYEYISDDYETKRIAKYKKNLNSEWKEIFDSAFVRTVFYLDDQKAIVIGLDFIGYTTNDGQSWDTWPLEQKIKEIRRTGGLFYIFNEKGILVSGDTCRSWSKISDAYIWHPALFNDSIIIGSDLYDLIISKNGGLDWTVTGKGFNSAEIMAIAFDKKSNLYTVIEYMTIFKSTDNGKTFQEIKYFRKKDPLSILIADNGYIFVGTASGNGFFRSTDEGKTWENLGDRMGDDRFITKMLFTKKGTIITNTDFPTMNRSTDYGETWEFIWTSGVAYSLNESPDGNILAGGERGRIYLSTDEGKTWENIGKDNYFPPLYHEPIVDIELNPKTGIGYAASVGLIAYSKDLGKKWNIISPYEDIITPGNSLTLDSIGNILMCSETVRRATDNIFVWDTVSSGLMHDNYTCIETSPDGYIFLGTDNGGLYRSRERYVSVKEDKPEATAAIYSVPNPASGSTEIHYTLTTPGEVNITIRDILGREYATFSPGYKQPGSHSQHFDTSGLPPGIYFILIESVGYRSVGNMIVKH